VERGDAVRPADPLDVVDEAVEGGGDRVGTLPFEQRSDADHHQESDRDEPMLTTGPRERGQLLDDGGGHVGREVVVAEVAFAWPARLVAGRAGDHPAAVLLAQLHVVGEVLGDQRVDERVALGRFALEADDLGRPGTGDQQLAVAGADEEHVERAGCDPDGHREVGALGGRRRVQRPLHQQPGVGRPSLVVVAAEQDQEGVTTELDHLAAVAVRRVDQGGEARVDQCRDLLGAGLALAGELLRQRREARDVGRQHRALETRPRRDRRVAEFDGEAGDERRQRRR
jgi:hypothetical protein